MKTKSLSLAAGFAALLFASSSIASTNPVISSSSENSVRISSARVVRALGGGSYVTGMTEPSFGYVAPRAAHVHVAAYDANGKLLAEKIDKINGNNLVRWHLRPRPRAPIRCSFPGNPLKSPRPLLLNTAAHTSCLPKEGRGRMPVADQRKPLRGCAKSCGNISAGCGVAQ